MAITRSHIAMETLAGIHRSLGAGNIQYGMRTTEDLRSRFVDLVYALQPRLSLEVGAHHGHYSRLLQEKTAANAIGTKIVAVEANPAVYEMYNDLMTKSGVDYRNLAVSDVTGKLTFKVPLNKDGTESSHMGSVLDYGAMTGTMTYNVCCDTLSNLVSKQDSYVLWVDVEGANRQVFSSSKLCIGRCLAALVEVEDMELWKGQMLADEFITFCEDNGLVAVARDYQQYRQYNIVLVRRDHQYDQRVEAFVHGYHSDMRKRASASG